MSSKGQRTANYYKRATTVLLENVACKPAPAIGVLRKTNAFSGLTVELGVNGDGTSDLVLRESEADGSVMQRDFPKYDGTSAYKTTHADGSTSSVERAASPTVGPASPFASRVVTRLPSGKEFTLIQERTAQGEDRRPALERASMLSLGKTVMLAQSTYSFKSGVLVDGRMQQVTLGGDGSQVTTFLGDGGLPAAIQVGSYNPSLISYRSTGVDAIRTIRPDQLNSASPNVERLTVMDYFPDREANGRGGWLSAMVDALGRETRFDYDKAGRMTSVTLHDGRKVGYTYDINGNLTSLAPPGRAPHLFTYAVACPAYIVFRPKLPSYEFGEICARLPLWRRPILDGESRFDRSVWRIAVIPAT